MYMIWIKFIKPKLQLINSANIGKVVLRLLRLNTIVPGCSGSLLV